MKITKAMGRACLASMPTGDTSRELDALDVRALMEIGWCDYRSGCYSFDGDGEHIQTALAMCAAIAGVKPE